MSIPSKERVIASLQNQLGITLHKINGKQLFYRGTLTNGKEVLVCTPESKLYPKGYWWVDITTIQTDLLEEADYAILAFRLEGDKICYIEFSQLKRHLTKHALKNNIREGNHWKLHIWPNNIHVLGNDLHLPILPNKVESLSVLHNSTETNCLKISLKS